MYSGSRFTEMTDYCWIIDDIPAFFLFSRVGQWRLWLIVDAMNLIHARGFPGGSHSKESTCNAGDLGLIPGLGRSPGGWHDNPLQYSCLEKPHGQEEPGGLPSMRSQRVTMTEWLSTAHQLSMAEPNILFSAISANVNTVRRAISQMVLISSPF